SCRALFWRITQLYGSFMGVHNPGEHQHVDGGRLGPQKRPCTGVDRGPGSQDVVDQDHAAALNPGLPLSGDLERALYVARPLRAGQADLLLGRPHAAQRFRYHLDVALPFDDARERAGLVVAPAPAESRVVQYWAMLGNNAHYIGLTFISDVQCRA